MQERTGSRWDEWIGRIDRRLVYLGLFLFTLTPLAAKWSLPLTVSEPPKKMQEAIEALPPDRVVFITSDWDAGTQAENRPQLMAIIRHLLRRKLKFVLMSVGSPTGPQLAQTVAEQAIEKEKLTGQWQYGKDWVNLGYKIANAPWLRSFSRSIQETMKQDWKNQPISQFPVMQGVDKFGPDGQVSMLIDITGSATIEAWYQYLTPTKVKLGLACTAVMAPEQYPYLDSGQLSGLLTGMKGAAEYESLIDAKDFGLAAMAGQSFAHLYIFILIVLGNASVVLGRRDRRRA
jgi:hypothetical protein